MDSSQQVLFFDEIISKVRGVSGVDLIYFIDSNNQMIEEYKISPVENHFEQVLNIIKLEPLSDKLSSFFYSLPFHTCTLLNEAGVIVISKITNPENSYLIVIAGEKEPVNLLNLIKVCKEIHAKQIPVASE